MLERIQRARVYLFWLVIAILSVDWLDGIHPRQWEEWSWEAFRLSNSLFLPAVSIPLLALLLPFRKANAVQWVRNLLLMQLLFYFFLSFLSGFIESPFLRYFGWKLMALLSGFLLLLLPRARYIADSRQFQHGLLVASIAPPLACLLLALLNIQLVSNSANAIADGRAYCIQVPDKRGLTYSELISLNQLNGLRMRAPFVRGGSSNFQFTFHAILLVETQTGIKPYSWSYKSMSFVALPEDGTYYSRIRRSPECKLQTEFLARLPN